MATQKRNTTQPNTAQSNAKEASAAQSGSKTPSRKLRQIVVKEVFGQRMPTNAMFQIVEEAIPPVGKGQFLVKAEYISVDPYMRSFASNQTVPYPQFGFQVGRVQESKHKDFPVDSYVVSHAGWSDFAVLDDLPDEMFSMKPYRPPLGDLPLSLALGALGMPGMTAYLGFLEICAPKKGDTVCVTSACGAVGTLVGQIAKIKKCTVIGFTGSDQKVTILKELGFDHAFNYKSDIDIQETLSRCAPNGINCYFDNVGGALSEKILECMANNSRVAICGAISTYQKQGRGKTLSMNSVSRSVNIESFSFTQWPWEKQTAALEQIRAWIQNKQITPKETITNGFEKLPDAFISMLKGENIGKAVVKI